VPVIDEILVSASPGEVRVAALSVGRLVDFAVERGADLTLGAVYRGRVVRVEGALGAAFVDIGRSRPGFLPAEAARHLVQPVAPPGTAINALTGEGAQVLVQAIRPETGDKGVGLTAEIALTGTLAVLMPLGNEIAVSRRIHRRAERERLKEIAAEATGGMGVILRSAAEGVDDDRLFDEIERLIGIWHSLDTSGATPSVVLRPLGAAALALGEAPDGARIVVDDRALLNDLADHARKWRPDLASQLALHSADEPLFARHDVESEIEAALDPRVDLPGGGSLVIEQTAALVAIDVNGGGSGRTPLEVDLVAAQEIARQLRLRNLGGLIVVDFLRPRGRDERDTVFEALIEACADDRVPVQVMGWTRAGLVELTRPRDRPPLAETMSGAVSAAHAALRATLAAARRHPAGRYRVLAAPALVAYLQGEGRGALEAAGRRLGAVPELVAEPGRSVHGFEIAAV